MLISLNFHFEPLGMLYSSSLLKEH
jgi:hypothetical protein